MAKLTGPTMLLSSETQSSSAVKEHSLGQLGMTSDGRKYRYCRAGAAVLVTGDSYSTAAQDAQFEAMALASNAAIGATEISFVLGTTTVAAHDFDEGFLMVASGTGIGQSSRILSHTTGTSGQTITAVIEDPLVVGLTTAGSSTITIVKNPYDDVVIQAVTPTGPCIGIASYPIPATEYGWLQTGGPAACLFDASVCAADTLGVAGSTTTAGTVRVTAAGAEYIGSSMHVVPVSAEVSPVFLTID
jgi:hypothetical protein